MEAGLSAAEAAVLLAVHRGARTPGEIAELLNASREDVERILERLEARGLVKLVERRRLLWRRREAVLTEKGLEAIPEAERLLVHAAEAARRAVEASRRGSGSAAAPAGAQVAAPLAFDAPWLLPALVALGFLEASLLPLLVAEAAADAVAWQEWGWDEHVEDDSGEDDLGGGGLDDGVDAGGFDDGF